MLVNPWNVSEMALTIETALQMSERERQERHRVNFAHVMRHTAQVWADTFLTELVDTHVEAALRVQHYPP